MPRKSQPTPSPRRPAPPQNCCIHPLRQSSFLSLLFNRPRWAPISGMRRLAMVMQQNPPIIQTNIALPLASPPLNISISVATDLNPRSSLPFVNPLVPLVHQDLAKSLYQMPRMISYRWSFVCQLVPLSLLSWWISMSLQTMYLHSIPTLLISHHF